MRCGTSASSGLAALAALAVFGFVQPASAVTVGSYDGGNCYPFNCNDSGTSVGQSVDYTETYNASAVGSININTVSFFSWPVSPVSPEVLSGTYDITFGTTLNPVGAAPGVLSNVAAFFDGSLGGPIGSTFSIAGTPYSYNSASGNLVMEVVVTNQTDLPNGPDNSYFWADYTGTDVSRSFVGEAGSYTGTGALVTAFNSPLPATWTMLIAGFVGLGFFAYRGSKKNGAAIAAA